MKSLFAKVVLLLSYTVILAAAEASASTTRETFCRQASNKAFFQNRLANTDSRIAFNNIKSYSAFNLIGIDSVQIGVCWWHSRFQRSLNYLAVPRPLNRGEKPMSMNEVSIAINQIINESHVVELRGYTSIRDFTERHQDLIVKRLTNWQLHESPQFVRGLVGHYEVDPENLKKKMHGLYQLVQVDKTIPFQVQQVKGLGAHSWLPYAVTKIYENKKWIGYAIMGVDSNESTMTVIYEYKFGDRHVGPEIEPFVPYTQRPQSELRYFTALAYYCQPEKTKTHLKNKFQLNTPTNGLAGGLVRPYAFDKSFLKPAKWASFLK